MIASERGGTGVLGSAPLASAAAGAWRSASRKRRHSSALARAARPALPNAAGQPALAAIRSTLALATPFIARNVSPKSPTAWPTRAGGAKSTARAPPAANTIANEAACASRSAKSSGPTASTHMKPSEASAMRAPPSPMKMRRPKRSLAAPTRGSSTTTAAELSDMTQPTVEALAPSSRLRKVGSRK